MKQERERAGLTKRNVEVGVELAQMPAIDARYPSATRPADVAARYRAIAEQYEQLRTQLDVAVAAHNARVDERNGLVVRRAALPC